MDGTGASSVVDATRIESRLGKGLEDLESARDEIVEQVMKAPERRIDNAITKLHDATCLRYMHRKVGDAIRKQYTRGAWQSRAISAGIGAAGAALTAAVTTGGAAFPWQLPLTCGVLSALSFAGSVWYGNPCWRGARRH